MTSSELITEFINTRHIHGSREDEDMLTSPDVLGAWLTAQGLLPAGEHVSATDLTRALAVREALRTLLLANNEVEVDLAPASAVLDEAAQRAGVELRFADGATALVPSAAGVAGALGRILAAVHETRGDGSWSRLKACRARDCEWAFVDLAKNQSRAWCSMRSCGNREKARLFRERQRSGA